MALSIKDEETDALVRKLARVRNVSYTKAIRLAVSNELAREPERKRPSYDEMLRKIRTIQRRVARLPVLDPRSADEILGYDEHGLPG